MAGAARIGSLHVMLGLNSAEFDAGLKQAKAGLGNFGKFAGKAMMGVAIAGAAAGAALAVAVKGAIDRADSMGELAQSIGVSVEALSSLGYAAKMSGTDLETLSTGLRKLSQNMLTVAQGSTGPVATAFKALGISVQGANGTLLSSDQVLIQVADKFSRMEDGALKTALAVQIFGRSGAELIPLLNQGRDGIGKLTDESDRFGATIDGTTAEAAGKFNDVLEQMQTVMQGVATKIAAAALPAITSLAETLASPQFAAAMQDFAILCINAANAIGQAFIAAHQAFKDFMTYIDGPGATMPEGKSLQEAFPEAYGGAESSLLRDLEDLQNGGKGRGAKDLYQGFGLDEAGKLSVQKSGAVLTELSVTLDDLAASSKGAAGGSSALKAALNEGKAVFEATRTPAETYSLEVEKLNGLLKAGAIDQDTYNRAVMQAQDAFADAKVEADDFGRAASDTLQGLAKDALTGKLSIDSLGDALGNLGNKFLDLALDGIFGGGKGLSGIGDFISSIFGGARANGGPVSGGKAYLVGERGPELMVPGSSGAIMSNRDLMGGGGHIAVDVHIGVENGNLVPMVTQVAGQVAGQQIKQNNKQLPNLMQDINMRQG